MSHIVIFGLKSWLDPLLLIVHSVLFSNSSILNTSLWVIIFFFCFLVQKSNSAAAYNSSAGASDR